MMVPNLNSSRTLSLQKERTDVYITGISGFTNAHAKWKLHGRIYSQVKDLFIELETLVLPKVIGTLPRLPTSLYHLRDIRFADPHFCEPENIDLLLRADVFASIMSKGRKQGPFHTHLLLRIAFLVGSRPEEQARNKPYTFVLTLPADAWKNSSNDLGNREITSATLLTLEEAEYEARLVST